MPYLTAPTAQETKLTYRYFAELASNEFDYEGLATHYRVIDVVVLEPTEEAIKTLIAATGWLKGYALVDFWSPQPETDEDTPF